MSTPAVITEPEIAAPAPETPAAAPSTPEVSAPPTAPAAPAAPGTPRDPEQALRDAVGKSMDKVPGYEVTPKPPEPKPAEPAKPAAEAAKPGEEPKPAEVKPGAEEPGPLDKLGPLPVETLAKAITDHPELAAALDKAGIDSELLYETSRRAALTDQFTEIFATPDAAEYASQNAQHFYDIEESFPKIDSVESFDSFVTNTMLPLSWLVDPATGKPLMNPDGKSYQTDGSIGRFFDAASQYETVGLVRAVDGWIAEYSKDQSDEGKEMLQQAQNVREAALLAQGFRDSGYRLPGNKGEPVKRSAEDQVLFDKLQKDNADAARVRAEGQQKESQAFEDGVITDTSTAVSAFIKGVLDQTSLNENEKRFIFKEAAAEVWTALQTNRHFQMQKEDFFSRGNTPENRARLVALSKNTFEHHAAKVLQRLVTEAGGKQISRQQQRQEKIDKQNEKDRMNHGAATVPGAKPGAPMTTAQVREQAIKNLKARNGGQMPGDGDIIVEAMTIRGLAQSA